MESDEIKVEEKMKSPSKSARSTAWHRSPSYCHLLGRIVPKLLESNHSQPAVFLRNAHRLSAEERLLMRDFVPTDTALRLKPPQPELQLCTSWGNESGK